MSPRELFAELNRVGVTIKVKNGALSANPASRVTPSLLQELKNNRELLLRTYTDPLVSKVIESVEGTVVDAYQLRPYQVDCIESVQESLVTHRSTVAVMATGLGKTICFAHLVKRYSRYGRCLVLAHREELIDQAAEKISAVTNLPVDIEMADRVASELYKTPVVVSSIQTQIAGKNGGRMKKFNPNEFAFLVVDECHHQAADSYRTVIEHYQQNPKLKMLGVTATPKRNDGLALGVVSESVAFRMGIVDGISEGWLVPIRVKHVQVAGLDLSEVGTVAGDFNQRDLSAVVERDDVLAPIALAVIENAAERKTIVFTASVEQAEQLTARLNEAKPHSAHIVTGATPSDQRRSMIDGFKKGKFQYLVNFAVLLEGFDVWDVGCIVCARPTKNAMLLEQMIGRGTRPDNEAIKNWSTAQGRRDAIAASTKPNCLIIDFVGVVGRHKVAKVIDVLGGKMPDAVRELAEEKINQGCESVEEAIRLADEELQRHKVTLRGKVVYANIEAFDLFRIEHCPGNTPVEPEQKAKLEKWNIPCPEDAESAQDIVDEVRRRARAGLCTFKMARHLKRRGHDPNMKFEEASKLMQEWFGNGK